MLQVALDVLFTVLAIRAIWKLLQGVMAGLSGDSGPARSGRAAQQRPSAAPPAQGVQMARDPICGTYVVPDSALSIRDGRQPVYFCSEACRSKYRAKSA
jgi:YHS domain-containing protein